MTLRYLAEALAWGIGLPLLAWFIRIAWSHVRPVKQKEIRRDVRSP